MIVSGAPMTKMPPVKERLKLLSYNKAVLIASCIADADKDRAPDAPAIPLRQNLVITTCIDIKLKQMQKFSDRVAYADFFFPERIESCGESSRLPEIEKVFRPYDFLELSEAKLFDFVRYRTQPGGNGGIDYDAVRDRITVHASTQVPYYVHLMLSDILDMDMSRIRVIKPHVDANPDTCPRQLDFD